MRDILTTRLARLAMVLGLSSTTLAPGSAAPASLCAPTELELFSCPLKGKVLSVCAPHESGAAFYRFGRPGRIELESSDLKLANRGFAGGGETEVLLEHKGYRYIVYARMVRTGFGPDGHNNPSFESGLLVQKDGRTVSSSRCGGTGDQPIIAVAEKRITPGAFVPH